MSSRRNGSVSRAAEAASKNRLHMDRNPQHSRITDPSNPAGRRKEIDNVMKRARQASPGSWDRKLLEVEEKDPNRWRHTGYKQLYLQPASSRSPHRSPPNRRSRSPVGRRSRSPLGRRSRSPIGRRSRSPIGRRSRSPIGRRTRSPLGRKSRSPFGRRSRSPLAIRSRSPLGRRSRSPVVRRKSRTPKRSPRRTPLRRSPVARRRSPRRSPARVARRPPSPPPPQSSSESSVSSCSDEECSVCSANNKKNNVTAKPKPPPGKPPSPGRGQAQARAVQPTRELLKAREGSKRTREEKVLEWQRSQLNSRPTTIPTTAIKREEEHAPSDPRRRPPAAAPHPHHDSASDSDSDRSDAQQKITLSERFGKMAQWSLDRSARLENMKITRRETTLTVRIEREPPDDLYPGAEPVAPAGSFPLELASAAPGGLPSWDDVTVRYDYYKKRGFLRGLTLGDYVKWEEWWYKYQEWLERERAYERWASSDGRPARRDRRRKGGRHRRS